MRTRIILAAALMFLSSGLGLCQGAVNGHDSGVGLAPTNSKSMNPAARYAKPKTVNDGTNVPGATGVNPYTGKSVGVPLQPNDLGSPEQRRKER